MCDIWALAIEKLRFDDSDTNYAIAYFCLLVDLGSDRYSGYLIPSISSFYIILVS